MNRFCSECGQKIESKQLFCPECGAPQSNAKIEENKTQSRQVNQAPIRKPLSFKKRLSFALIALLAVGVVAGHQIIKANTSPQQKVDAFLQALYSGDTDASMAAITIPENVEKDEQAFQEFLADQDLEDFQYRMYEAASGVVDDGITRIVFHEDGTELFRIKESKFIGMYPGIQIEAIPVDVRLVSDSEGAKVELGNKIVTTINGDVKIGSYLPGRYTCPVSLESGGIGKPVELECRILGPEEAILDVSIKGMSVEIWSNHKDAIVHINGESTEKNAEEMNLVGLLQAGETVDLFVERTNDKGESERSEEVTATAGSFVKLPVFTSDTSGDLNFSTIDSDKVEEKDEEFTEPANNAAFDQEELASFISDFRSAYESSLNNKDFSYIDEFLKEGSIAREELVEFIGDIGDEYYLYEFLVDEAVDFEIFEEKAFVTTYEEFNFTNHLDVVTNYARSKKYEVHENADGTPKIVKIEIMDTVRDN